MPGAPWTVRLLPYGAAAWEAERRLRDPRPVPRVAQAEAWFAYALWRVSRPGRSVPLRRVLGSADAVAHAVMAPDEVAFAVRSLRRRGWLVPGRLALTPQAWAFVEREAGGPAPSGDPVAALDSSLPLLPEGPPGP